MPIKINLDKNNNRLLLLSVVEFFLQSYGSNQLGNDLFAFHSPLTGQIIKVRHINHRFDRVTDKLLRDYKAIRREILDNTIGIFNLKHAVELSVVIEDYVMEFKNNLDEADFQQLKVLDNRFRKAGETHE